MSACPLCHRKRCLSGIQCAFTAIRFALKKNRFARCGHRAMALRKSGVTVLCAPTYCVRVKAGYWLQGTLWAPAAALVTVPPIPAESLPGRPADYDAALHQLVRETTVRSLGGHAFLWDCDYPLSKETPNGNDRMPSVLVRTV